MVKKKIRAGNLVRMGSIVKLDGDSAMVNFPTEYINAVVPVSQLEKAGQGFGPYARIQVSATRRPMYPTKGRV